VSKLFRALLLVLAIAAPAAAQVTGPPFVFTAGTVINPDEMNLNFSTIYAAACNRGGCTMTGSLLFSADNTLDIGASGATRPRDLFLGRNAALGGTLAVTGASTFAALSGTTLALSNTGATAIDVDGGITAGSGNVGIVDTTGKIPAISSTFFASLSGANLTGIPETAIADGSILARVASAEDISGTWTVANNVSFQGRNNAGTALNLATVTSGNILIFGPTNAQVAAGVGVNSALTATGTLDFATNQVSRTVIGNTGTLTHNYALALTNVISPAALAAGNNNNYNPTDLASSFVIRVIADPGGTSVLTGLTAQPAGSLRVICEINGNTLVLANQSGSSSGANGFQMMGDANVTWTNGYRCGGFWYDGTSGQWRQIW
jgi:hypothetical protein